MFSLLTHHSSHGSTYVAGCALVCLCLTLACILSYRNKRILIDWLTDRLIGWCIVPKRLKGSSWFLVWGLRQRTGTCIRRRFGSARGKESISRRRGADSRSATVGHPGSCRALLKCRWNAAAFGGRRFSVAVPWVWNSLPQKIRNYETLGVYKTYIQTFCMPRHN